MPGLVVANSALKLTSQSLSRVLETRYKQLTPTRTNKKMNPEDNPASEAAAQEWAATVKPWLVQFEARRELHLLPPSWAGEDILLN